MRYLPLFHDLAGRACLVVGGDESAARKIRLLLRAGAEVLVVAERTTPEIAELIAEGSVRRVAKRFSPRLLDGVALAIVAEDAAAPAVKRAAEAVGVPLNVVDRPELSTVVMPAIVDRDPVVVAIASAGTAPVLARRLRERIEALLPSRLGALARFAASFRSAVAALRPDGDARRRFWEQVIDGPIGRQVLAGEETAARDGMLRLLNRAPEMPVGSVVLVGVGPGDPDLLTLKALRAMQDADVVVHDALIGPGILDCVRRDARRIDVGKRKGRHSRSQEEICRILLEEAEAGRRVVRLKGGDPFLFGRGGEELLFLREHGIAVEVVPGITAAVGAAATAEIPLTHRGLAQSCTLLTGHGADGEPDLDPALLAGEGTLAIYMGVSVADRLARRIIAAGRPPGTPVAVIERASWPDQRNLYSTLDDLGALVRRETVSGPALLIVGSVARLGRQYARPQTAAVLTASQ